MRKLFRLRHGIAPLALAISAAHASTIQSGTLPDLTQAQFTHPGYLQTAKVYLNAGLPAGTTLTVARITPGGKVLLALQSNSISVTDQTSQLLGYIWERGATTPIYGPAWPWIYGGLNGLESGTIDFTVTDMNDDGVIVGQSSTAGWIRDRYDLGYRESLGIIWPNGPGSAPQVLNPGISSVLERYDRYQEDWSGDSSFYDTAFQSLGIDQSGNFYGVARVGYDDHGWEPDWFDYLDDVVKWENPTLPPANLTGNAAVFNAGGTSSSASSEILSLSPDGHLLVANRRDAPPTYHLIEPGGIPGPALSASLGAIPSVVTDSGLVLGFGSQFPSVWAGGASTPSLITGYHPAASAEGDVLHSSEPKVWLRRPSPGGDYYVPATTSLASPYAFPTGTRRISGGLFADGTNQAPLLRVPARLCVDDDHDGVILSQDAAATAGDLPPPQPFYFWSNDDDDDNDISTTGPTVIGNSDEPGRLAGFWELDGRTPDYEHAGVDGRSDLLDFFPVYLDIKQLLAVLPHGGSIQYKLKQADGALNFVYTNLTRSEAFDYLYASRERVAYGLPGSETQAHIAVTEQITSAGIILNPFFLDRIKTEPDKGVILIESRAATSAPLRLVVEKDGTEIAEVALNIKISPVEQMFRWVNLRGLCDQSQTRPTDLSEPLGYPDSATNGKMFVWVHGYNVNERQSRAWFSEAFKRLYQSGSRAMFTAVSWHGDKSQVPIVGFAPDYWDNIPFAFRTGEALAPIVNNLPGSSKVIAGHSMGNVVVSAAIKDHGMNVAKYFMVDAAVALEAYDTSVSTTGPYYVNAMRPLPWANFERRLWPTDWWKLFPEGDNRRRLTWMNRFGNIPHAINVYSSGEEVLNNNDATPGELPYFALPFGPERVWIQQEMSKGGGSAAGTLAGALNGEIQGGWGLNEAWGSHVWTPDPTGGGSYTHISLSATDAAALTDEQLRAQPFFGRFTKSALMNGTVGAGSAGSNAADDATRDDLLGGAIPALSFPAGRNSVPLFENRNRDLMQLQDGWPASRLADPDGRLPGVFPYKGRWFHSDIKNIAYPFNRSAWDFFTNEGNLR